MPKPPLHKPHNLLTHRELVAQLMRVGAAAKAVRDKYGTTTFGVLNNEEAKSKKGG